MTDVARGEGTLSFPDLEDRLGEHIVNTAAHVLHRDLLEAGDVQDETILSRIRGIDTPEEIAAYRAVETRTRNRDRIHELLDERADWLKKNGFRPDDLTVALLDSERDLPHRFRLRVPLWVSTADLRETPDVGFENLTGSASGSRSFSSSPVSASRSTQVTLADGGVSNGE